MATPIISGRGHLFGGPNEGSPIVFTPIKRPPTHSLIWPCFEKADNRQESKVECDD